jgi:anti-sigma factor RsiW
VSGPGRPVPEEDLQAYVDNLLDADRRAVVARFLQENPDAAARVAAYSAQRETLRAALAGYAEAPVPSRLDVARLIQLRLANRRAAWRIAAAVVLALGVGGSGGWILRGALVPPTSSVTLLVREAVANHVVYTADRRRPTELGADQREDLARWVSNRLNLPVAPPDLATYGFHYMGGRLAATSEGPAGMFMYQNEQGLRLTVFLRPVGSAPSVPMEHVDSGKLGGCAWIAKGVGYTVVADMPAAELKRVADLVQEQLHAAI